MNLRQLWYKFYLRFLRVKRIPGDFFYRYSIKKDDPDHRDFEYKLAMPEESLNSYSYLPINSSNFVKSQGAWGSCGSHAITTAIEIMQSMNKVNMAVPLSEKYHYHYARKEMNNFPKNGGMTSRVMLKIAQKRGLTPEKLCPYISSEMNVPPTRMADGWANTGWWKIDSYYRVIDQNAAKQAIMLGHPVLVGTMATAQFKSFSGSRIDIVPKEKIYGGHEFLLVGYDDKEKAFLMLNSWGFHWKDNSFAWISYDYLEKYLIDMWTIYIKRDGD